MLSRARIEKFKGAVLGRRFELSVAYVQRPKMRRLNNAYRRSDSATDILSFSLSKNSGEIILCLPEVRTHARAWDMPARAYLPYLVIHGLLHIKGLVHGRIMSTQEQKFCTRLGVQHPSSIKKLNGTAHRSRH